MAQVGKADDLEGLTGACAEKHLVTVDAVCIGDALLDVVVRIAVAHRVLEGVRHRLERLLRRPERVLVRREVRQRVVLVDLRLRRRPVRPPTRDAAKALRLRDVRERQRADRCRSRSTEEASA